MALFWKQTEGEAVDVLSSARSTLSSGSFDGACIYRREGAGHGAGQRAAGQRAGEGGTGGKGRVPAEALPGVRSQTAKP